MPRLFRLGPLLVPLAFLIGVSGMAATFINDPFTDGSATNTTGGDPLGSVYYQAQTGSTTMQVVNDSSGIGTGNALKLTPAIDFAKIITFFTPYSLSNPGDAIQVSFNFRFATAPIDAFSGFRIGIYFSNGTRQTSDAGSGTRTDDQGYGFYTDPGSSTGSTSLFYEAAGTDILGGPTASGLTAFGTSVDSVSCGATGHTAVYEIVRQANGDLAVSAQIDSSEASTGVIPAASVLTYTLDEFAVADGGTGIQTPFLIDNLKIIAANLPAVTLTAPATSGTYAMPASITVSATASETSGTIASVQLYANTTSIALSSSASASSLWSPPASGIYSLTAVATDKDGFTVSSPRLNIRVTGTADGYDNLRIRWVNVLTGGTTYSLSDSNITSEVSGITNSAQGYWNTMNTSPGRTYLWSDAASTTSSADISTSFSRLEQMALAYSTRGSTLLASGSLKAAIASGLDWMYANRYNENLDEYDNWYDWEISSPQSLTDTVAMLYNVLTPDEIANSMAAVDHFLPAADMTASNLAMKAQAVTVRGIIVKNASKVAQATGALSQIFQYVTDGDGYYSDGSFIQHDAHPYTGGYGKDCLGAISNELYLLHGSFLDVTDTNQQNVYQWIYSNYQPLIYKGGMMSMQSGRDASRSADDEHALGQAIITSIIQLSQIASATNAANYQGMAKAWLLADTYRDYLSNQTVANIILGEPIVTGSSVTAAPALVGDFQFPGMDRAVHLRSGFGFGLSMSSSRIYNYESINNENLHGWYTGDGMALVYNSDLGQFSDDFWPTVNPYRLPGTTVDTGTLANAANQSSFKVNNWVGGTRILGSYGADGLELDTFGSDLSAFKSWFMFDDEIVELGAGITATSGDPIESIVENRKIGTSGNNVIEISGTTEPAALGWSGTFHNVNWCYLDITGGYYFPGGATLGFLREARTGSWAQINSGQSSASLTRNYATFWYNHGVNPTNASYAYVVLPNYTPAQTSAYAASPQVTILENSTQAQAARETTLNITGVNFWNDASKTVDIITCNKKASVMMVTSTSSFEVAVSDPTQANTGTITLGFNRPAASVLSADAGITVTQLTPTVQMTVNVNNSLGKTFDVKFNSPIPTVAVSLSGTQAPCESGPVSGVFTVSRTGSTNASLPVTFTLTGSAVNGSDYNSVSSPVTIPVGASSASVIITPIPDEVVDGPRSVVLTLQPSIAYTVAGSGSNTAQMTITDELIDQWRQAEFGALANSEPDTASPSGSGITNLMAYALSLNPKTPFAAGTLGLPILSATNGRNTLTYNQLDNAPDITYTVEVSSDLTSWFSGVGQTTQATLSDNGAIKKIISTDSTANAPHRFIRLKVTRP